MKSFEPWIKAGTPMYGFFIRHSTNMERKREKKNNLATRERIDFFLQRNKRNGIKNVFNFHTCWQNNFGFKMAQQNCLHWGV